MRYYHCTDCGYVGDFGFDRQRNVSCSDCGESELLTELTLEEYNKEHSSKKVIRYGRTESQTITR